MSGRQPVPRRYGRGAFVVAAALLALTGCGADEQRATSPQPTTDDAFVVRISAHMQTAQELARVGIERAKRSDVRRLSRQIQTSRAQLLEDLAPQREALSAYAPQTLEQLPDLGVGSEAAGETITPAAVTGVQPFDDPYLATVARHDDGALALLQAARTRVQLAETKALVDRLLVRYQRERDTVQRMLLTAR